MQPGHVKAVAFLFSSFTLAPLARAQQSAQVFDAPVIAVPDEQQRMNALLDLDGDGWTDAVGTFWKNDSRVAVSGFLNDGTGRLQPLFEHEWTQYGDDDMPFPIAAADLNGDGLDDFVAAVRGDFEVFLSNGAAAPTLAHSIYMGSGNEAQDLVLGDYDGDGTIEAAVRLKQITTGIDRGIRIYDDLVQGPRIEASLVPPAGAGWVLKNADVDGNAALDLMCVGSGVALFTLRPSGLVSLGSHALGLSPIANAASGDIDGDGDADIVAFDSTGVYHVLRRIGEGFAVEPPRTGGPATGLADVDADGDLDGVCCGGGGGGRTYSNNGASKFEIAINDGTGNFAPSFKLPSMGANEIAGVTDLDHDGDADLVAGRVVYYNVYGIAPVTYGTATTYTPPSTINDVDGDGDLDIQTSAADYDRNRGDGMLTSVARIVPAPPPGSAFGGPGVQADFDGDGDVDIIVQELSGGLQLHERVLYNTGGGGLVDGGPVTAAGVTFLTSQERGDTLTGDVNGDGRIDVVARVISPVTTKVFVQQQDGTFSSAVILQGEYAKKVVDLDGDGYDDLVTLDDVDWQIRYGDAGASMSALREFAQSGGTYWYINDIDAGDLDGDGDLDLVGPVHLATVFSKGVRVVETVGPRQYAVHDQLFPSYEGALVPTIIADVNADGSADVLLGQRYDPGSGNMIYGTSVFLGSAAPGLDFAPTGDVYPIFWTVADFDGDGDPDAIGGTGTQTIYPSHAIRPPDGGYRMQYGSATPGSGGQAPTLGASGPFRPGGKMELRVTGAAPNAPGSLFLGATNEQLPLPVFGAVLEVMPITVALPFATTGTPGAWGTGTFAVHLTIPALAGGSTVYQQAAILDPAAQGGVCVTNALELRYGK